MVSKYTKEVGHGSMHFESQHLGVLRQKDSVFEATLDYTEFQVNLGCTARSVSKSPYKQTTEEIF